MSLKTITTLLAILLTTCAFSQKKATQLLEKSATILEEFYNIPNDHIAETFINEAEAVVLIPKLVKVGLCVGGKGGKGVAMIKDEDGDWSAPIFVKLSGASVGFQIGFQSSEYILIFKDKRLIEEIDGDEFTLGGDISGTAGPEGRNASTATDFKSNGGMFAYSRSKGLFAGISIEGTAISLDKKLSSEYYDADIEEGREVFEGNHDMNEEIIALHLAINSKFF